MLTVHVIAPFHSRLLKEKWSHCAFTQITLKQIRIFRDLGCHVVDYSNYGSESAAHEHVSLLQADDFGKYFTDDGKPGHKAEIGSEGWDRWFGILYILLRRKLEAPGDHIVIHTFADAASRLVSRTQGAIHLESHVGYERPPFGVPRVFVSQAWRHYHYGKYGTTPGECRYNWVILPYYDVADWPADVAHRDRGYVAYMGRVVADKGMTTISAVAEAMPDTEFHVAGFGNPAPFAFPGNVVVRGMIEGKDRAAYLGGASVLLAPSEYVEPCAGVVCEAAITGTPAIASAWGGYTETISPGKTGFVASTLEDWIEGIRFASGLNRSAIAEHGRRHFSLEAAAKDYGEIFRRLLSLKGDGWYARRKAA